MQTEISRIREGDKNADSRRIRLTHRIASSQAEQESIAASMPDNWGDAFKVFKKLQLAETKARNTYRRTVDKAYDEIANDISVIEGINSLAAVGEPLKAIGPALDKETPEAMEAKVHDVIRLLNPIRGTDDIREVLSSMRRDLRSSSSRAMDKAKAAFDKAVAAYDAQMAWGTRAQKDLLPGLKAYEKSIRMTIGVRKQPRLPDETALKIAVCDSHQRDVSLNF